MKRTLRRKYLSNGMERFFIFALASVCLGLVPLAAQDRPLNGLEIKIVDVSHSGGIAMELGNRSKSPIEVWRDSNSWGAARWRVLRIRRGKLEAFYQNPDQRFTRNIPTANQIAPGAQIEEKLDLNSGNWCGFGHCSDYNERGIGGREVNFQSGDTVVVIYDVPSTSEATSMAIWYGMTAALTIIQ